MRQHIFGPAPWGGAKRSNSVKFQLQSQLNQTLCVFSQMKNIKHIRRDFHSVFWVMPQRWDSGVPWGLGVKKCFPKFNQIWCASCLHEWHMQRLKQLMKDINILDGIFIRSPWSCPMVWVLGSKLNFLNMVMCHIKLKGVSSRPGYTENF